MIGSLIVVGNSRKRNCAPRSSSWNCCTWVFLACHYHAQALDHLFGLRGGRHTTPTALQHELIQRAAKVRFKLGPSPVDYAPENLSSVLYFDSSYPTSPTNAQRGFCNWLLPKRLMVGQYPGQVPEKGEPSPENVREHLQRMSQLAKVRLFCSLQTEVPPQDDYETWNKNRGMMFLEPESLRQQFSGPFTHYAPLIREFCDTTTFLQCPIEDLNVPESEVPMQRLLLQLLDFLDETDGSCIYLHCWGGRGRAGLVGACLLSLLYPHLTPDQILWWIQTGYASRLGHDSMHSALAVSPQTSAQRTFVKEFVKEYQYHSKEKKTKK